MFSVQGCRWGEFRVWRWKAKGQGAFFGGKGKASTEVRAPRKGFRRFRAFGLEFKVEGVV